MTEGDSLNDINFYQDSSHLKSLAGFYDYQSGFENEKNSSKSEEINDKNNSISFIQKNLDESLGFSDLIRILETENDNEIKKIDLRKINIYIEKILDLVWKSYFRYIKRDENNKINNIFNTCQYIPLIKLEENKILFHDGNGNGKYFDLKEIFLFYNQLFIREDEINNNNQELIEVFNEGYICKIHNENYFKFCKKCEVNICKNCKINHIDHELVGSDENINNIIIFIQRGINKIMKRNNIRIKKKKKKEDLFLNLKSCMKMIYCILIKKIIREKRLMKNRFNYNIELNIINAYKLLKERNLICKVKNNNNKKYTPKCSIKWMTEFYSKNQINNKNKNIWISITSTGFVIIYLLNLFEDSKAYNSEDIFKELNQKELDITTAAKIMRLEECFNPNDKEKNYFLIGSFHLIKSIVISVTHDYKKIEEVQVILNNGIISSIEVKLNHKYFLLQSKNNNFYLWLYGNINNNKGNNNINNSINDNKGLIINDIIETTFEREELKTNLISESNKFKIIYREIISYVIKKNLLIVHIYSLEPFLLFYKINQNEKLNLILIGQIKPREDQNGFSVFHNNSIILENKFLIIGAKINNSKNHGGFYVINLDKIEISYYFQERNCIYFNSLLNYKNNMFICSTKFKGIQNKNKLILYEFIIEKNEKFSIKKKCAIKGNYSLINNTSIISDCFLMSSTYRTNSLIKITNDKITLCSKYDLGKKYTKNNNVNNENNKKIKINIKLFN